MTQSPKCRSSKEWRASPEHRAAYAQGLSEAHAEHTLVRLTMRRLWLRGSAAALVVWVALTAMFAMLHATL